MTAILLSVCTIGLLIGYFIYPPAYRRFSYPDGKAFAFTIVDDTDVATLENIRPVYELLERLGLRTTKTIWMLPTNDPGESPNRGQSLRDPAYKEFIMSLREKGFEIASHGARGGSSKRGEILAAMEEFKNTFGDYPNIHVNHHKNAENIYWGKDKFAVPLLRWIYGCLAGREIYYGHVEGSDYYWGDFVRQNVKYVPNFSFPEINVLKLNPSIPYHLREKECVNYWYHSCNGGTLEAFNVLLSKGNLDKLEREGGVAIVYTHFGKGFCLDGKLDETFQARLRDVALRNGWCAPAGTILDYLSQVREEEKELSLREKVRIELIWLWQKARYGRY